MSNKYIKDSHGFLSLPYRHKRYSVTDQHNFKQRRKCMEGVKVQQLSTKTKQNKNLEKV
jgi:hypothetical protein